MKKILIFTLMSLFSTTTFCQKNIEDIQCAFNICVDMSNAIASGNTSGLRSANDRMKSCKTAPFNSLAILDENPLSLDGHFIFDEFFIDDLIKKREVYSFAQRYLEDRKKRGASSSGYILVTTCAVKASSSTRLGLMARGRQELAFVTEPAGYGNGRGLITIRIHDRTHDIWHNDTENVNEGMPTRSYVINLPANENTFLEIEVINCGDKDISFAVIGN